MSKSVSIKSTYQKRLYLDTMVLVHYVFTRIDRIASYRVKKLFKKIEKGDYEGVISLLTLMECTKVFRRLLVQSLNCKPKDWKKAMSKFLKALFQINNLKFVEGNPSDRQFSPKIKDLLYGDVLWQAYTIMEKYPGKVVQDQHSAGGVKHDGLSACDCMHICVAKAMGCNNIATFDHDFEESKAEIEPFMVQNMIR